MTLADTNIVGGADHPTGGERAAELTGEAAGGSGESAKDARREGSELETVTRRLLEVAQNVLAELDLDVVLNRVLDAGRELTGAGYAALGILDESRTGLARFISLGLDERVERAIGASPRGRGVLGELILDPRPLRVADLQDHPRSYGFPPGHPQMRTFLGVSISIAGQPFGNLYLTDKRDGACFTDSDEDAVCVLAEFAGLAIDHAHRYRHSEERRSELQRTVDALDATVQIGRALAGETDLGKVLELVAKRARALISARALVIELRRQEELVVGAAAGEVPDDLVGSRLKLQNAIARVAMFTLTTQRLDDARNRSHFDTQELGKLGVSGQGGLVVPLKLRGRAYGVLVAIDRLQGGPHFTAQDQRLLEWFAASAATAVVTALSVAAERERERVAAAEEERGRWSRELHEGTMQRLAGLQLALASAQRAGTLAAFEETVSESIVELRSEIANLRSLSFELRPTALDDLGVEPAITHLADEARRRGINVELRLEVPVERQRGFGRYSADLETAIYRIVQEALTNVQKHAKSTRALVTVRERGEAVEITIRDNGAGFDPADIAERFGLVGMRERIELLDGVLSLDSSLGRGTAVHASIPVRDRTPADPGH